MMIIKSFIAHLLGRLGIFKIKKWFITLLFFVQVGFLFAQNQIASVDLRREVREYLDVYSYQYQFVRDPSHPDWEDKLYFEETEEKLKNNTLTEQEANDFLEKLKGLLNRLIEQHFKDNTGYDGSTDPASIQSFIEGQLGADFANQISSHLKEQAEATPEDDYFMAVLHCEVCNTDEETESETQSNNQTLTVNDGSELPIKYTTESLGSPKSYAKIGNCVYLFYQINKDTGDDSSSSFPTENSELPTGGSFLGIMTSLDLTFICSQQLGSWSEVICEENFNLATNEAYADNLFANLETCLTDHLEEEEEVQSSDYVTSFNFNYAEGEDYNKVLDAIREQLQVDFFSDVKLAVNVRSDTEATRSILSKGLSSEENAEISVNIFINEAEGKAYLKIDPSEEFLNEYVANLQAQAAQRGIEVDMEEMRQQVLDDLRSLETHNLFADFCQSISALFSESIGTFVEVVQTTQKASKTVWRDGQMSRGHWWSKADDRGNWPSYAEMSPVIAGPLNGVIDELVGIPMAIRSIYGVMTDSEQREAFKQLFTKDGMKAIIDGIGKELDETFDDSELTTEMGGRTVVMVGSIFLTGGITKTGKGLNTLDNLLNGLSELQEFQKLTAWLGNIKKVNKTKPEVFKVIKKQFDEVFEKFPLSRKELDELVGWAGTKEGFNNLLRQIHKFKEIPGMEKVIKEMVTQKNKFIGGKFVLNFAEKGIGGNSIRKIVSFELTDFDASGQRIYDLVFQNSAGKQIRAEMKNWDSFYPSTIRNQFVKDLNKMTDLGELKWFFNKTSGIPDQKILKEKFISSLKKADGSPVDELSSVSTDQVRKNFG